jgi:hypothetical protein
VVKRWRYETAQPASHTRIVRLMLRGVFLAHGL